MESSPEHLENFIKIMRKDFDKKIRSVNPKGRPDSWICLNCGMELSKQSCPTCYSAEYVVPDNDLVRNFLKFQELEDNITSVIHRHIKQMIKQENHKQN